MVNRLMKGGRVIERNRTAASSALDRHESATATATATENATASPQTARTISPSELTALRDLCTSVLALIDNYNSTGGALAALSSNEAKSA